MDMNGIQDGAFDRGYAIESTCHAQDKQRAFQEIFRGAQARSPVLGPGNVPDEQVRSERQSAPRHQRGTHARHSSARHRYVLGGEPGTRGGRDSRSSKGWTATSSRDRPRHGINQWKVGTGHWVIPCADSRGAGKALTGGIRLAEALRLFPRGSSQVVRLLDRTAEAYVAGGRTGIFTPLYCFLARKPL